MPTPHERLAIFIDGPDFLSMCRHTGLEVDFKRLLELFRTQGHLVRAHFYAITPEAGDPSTIRPLLDWLDYNGYTTTRTAIGAHSRVASGIELDLAIDAMRLGGSVDRVVIISGAGEFTKLVRALKAMGTCVTVVATLAPQRVAVADELRRAADRFVDVAELKKKICRQSPNPRSA